MTDKKAMAKRFSEGWHEGIKIDASDIMLLSQAAEALAQPEQEPACPKCKAEVLYECVACSSNNYPPQRTEPPQKKVWTFWDLSGGDIADAIKAKLKEKNT